ncbi:MAG: hypothetical protein LBF88_13780 [Planctomycetaceae bacterium]|jgi:hypothetical protein|nr:hypothetical protein [Planctomycetaceae bacterium]
MSDLQHFDGTTSLPIQETAISTEFDPVSEIRKLRKNLTHRIQLLHSSDATVSHVPVSALKENTNKIDIDTKIEETENVNKTQTNTPLPATTENQTVENRTTEFLTTELVQQIHQARQLLAQLQITPNDNKTPPKTTKNKQETNQPEHISASKTKPLETSNLFFPPLGALKVMNTVLTCCGFLGILFSLQYLEHNNRLELTITVASLILIIVGFLGRFCLSVFHENNRNKLILGT